MVQSWIQIFSLHQFGKLMRSIYKVLLILLGFPGLYRLSVSVLEKEMATHSSINAWRIWRTEEPGGLQSMGSQRVGYNWATSLPRWLNGEEFDCQRRRYSSVSQLGRYPREGNGNPHQYSCLENPRTEEPVGYIHWVTKKVRHDLATKKH